MPLPIGRIPETFCDKTPEAEVALNRLVELMVHALNRTTEGSDSQTFSRCALPPRLSLAIRTDFASLLPLVCLRRVVERKIPSLEKVTRQHIFKPIVGIISNLGQGKAGPESSLLLDACTRNASVTLDSFKYAPAEMLAVSSFLIAVMPPYRGLDNDADCNAIVERAACGQVPVRLWLGMVR